MKKQVFLLLISTLIVLNAQNRIRGLVINADTNEPLFYANVFFNNTTIGTTTDQDGIFELRNMPAGRYELIVSYMGYEKSRKVVVIKKEGMQGFDIKLKPKPVVLNNVWVEEDAPLEWRKNFEIFKEQFLGRSVNAEHCEITNPEVIMLAFRDLKLFAASNEPILVRNKATGYELSVHLNDFVYDKREDNLLSSKMIHFKELEPESEKERNEWEAKRQTTYKGSFTHFLKSLASNKLLENGFVMDFLRGEKKVTTRLISPDRLLADMIRHETIRTRNNIVRFIEEDQCSMELKKRILRIIYLDQPEEINFYRDYRKFNPVGTKLVNDFQTTLIILPIDPYIFDSNGLHENYSNEIYFYGYWSWERISDLMPFDFRNKNME